MKTLDIVLSAAAALVVSAGLAACGGGGGGSGVSAAPPATGGNPPAVCDGLVTYAVGQADGELVDGARGRTVPYRLYYPQGAACSAAVILVSHGGNDAPNGQLQLGHLGNEYARAGYLALHIGHRASVNAQQHGVVVLFVHVWTRRPLQALCGDGKWSARMYPARLMGTC